MEEIGSSKSKSVIGIISVILCFSIIFFLLWVSGTSFLPDTVTAFAVSDDNNGYHFSPAIKNASESAQNNAKAISKNITQKKLLLGGMPFGIKLYTDGILISGTSEVDTENGNVNPGELAGLKAGDIIKKINGKEVISISDVMNASYESDGEPLLLTLQRGEKRFETEIQPVRSVSENAYKLGLWIRDGTAGIGTVTYIDPETNYFGGLGHGVCDSDSGEILPMSQGKLNEVTISNIEKGKKGDPGELQGYFSSDEIGVLISNTDYGVFGVYNKIDTSNAKEVYIGTSDSVTEGPATILCTLNNNNICEYDIEIEKINKNSTEIKNFVIKVTDTRLLEKTGGIVQGMSGSPVIQNGKLIGAVTHVLVEDPQKGYGIFIENMLAQNNSIK